MGGGGGGPSNTTQTSIPEYAQPYVERMMGRAEGVSNLEYQPYQGQRIADQNPITQQANEAIMNAQLPGQTAQASQMAQQAGQAAGNLQPYEATQFDSGKFGADQAAEYMSPYYQQVVDIQKQEANRDNDMLRQQNQAAAVNAGAFGGSRHGIVDSEANRNLAMLQNKIQAEGSQSAYENAQQMFNADRNASLQAQGLSEQSKQFGADQGLKGLNTQMQAAGLLGQLGDSQLRNEIGLAQAQGQVGKDQQAYEQQGLDMGYQDYVTQQQYPYQQLGFMSDMLRGLPLSDKSVYSYQQPPSMASQLGGMGLAGLGLYNATK